MQAAARSDHDAFAHHAIWPNLTVQPDLRLWMHDGRWMDHSVWSRSKIMLHFPQNERNFCFADRLTLNFADSLRLAQLAPHFRHFHFDHERIPGMDWFAPFHI